MYMFSPTGLYPAPLAKDANVAYIDRVKSMFRFLGRFMARALMDSRMVLLLLFCVVLAISVFCFLYDLLLLIL